MARETNDGDRLESDLERGRSCYGRRQWSEAFAALQRAERCEPLAYPDLEILIWSAALSGDDAEFLAGLERQHRACAEADELQRAARAAFWLGFRLLSLDAPARASAWLARARRHVDDCAEECAERGYLL